MGTEKASIQVGFLVTPTNVGGPRNRIPIEIDPFGKMTTDHGGGTLRWTRRNCALLMTAFALFGVAALLFWSFLRNDSGISEKSFFYDLSEKKLFVADRGLVPPIRGLNDAFEDGVRAVVVSTNGQPKDKATWKVAYLEMYSPELKQELMAAKAAGVASRVNRGAAQSLRFVKRVQDAEWVSLTSAEGEQLVTEWVNLGTPTTQPVVCSPE